MDEAETIAVEFGKQFNNDVTICSVGGRVFPEGASFEMRDVK